MQRTTVLLLFGGESSEHEVSISSARNVYAAMDDTKFDVVLCFIDKNGRWWLLSELTAQIDTSQAPQLVAALGGKSFLTLPGNRVVTPDVILPILHGKNGEDGSVQGLAQLMHIPIVGCDVTSSALAMDKVASKQIFAQVGLKIVPYLTHRGGDEVPSYSSVVEMLGDIVFVKPSRAGSSVGVSKVKNEDEFIAAIQEAHRHDDVALIERAISGRELEVAVLGSAGSPEASGVGEIMPDGDFYSYESKYDINSASATVVPASIDNDVAQTISKLAGEAYTALGCNGMARVDFFLAEDGTIYINEINTIPGFTNISMYPKLWRASGVSYPELIERLIKTALHS